MRADATGEGPLYRALLHHAQERPDAPALADADHRLDYAATLHEVDRRAATLAASGDAWTVLDEQADGKLGFALDYLAAARANTPVVVAEGTALTSEIAGLLRARTDEVRGLGLAAPEVMFTSGSSSRAKAVLLDGHRMYGKARRINAFMGDARHATEILTLPLRHSFGLGRLRCAIAAGRGVRLVDRLESPDGLFAVADAYPSTGLALIATQVKILLDRYPGALGGFADRLAYLEIGSEPMEAGHRRALTGLLPDTRLGMHYGMTELSRATMVDLHAPGPAGLGAGHPLPDVELAFDAGDGTGTGEDGVPEATEGEILLRGDAMLRAYVDDTGIRPVAPGSRLRTGDHGHRAADGSLVVEGRLSNVVKILGKKVSMEETESALRPLLAGGDCVCVASELVPGVTTLVAVVEANGPGAPDRAALHRELGARLPAHQVPRRFVTVDRLPRLPGGKTDRRAAAELARRRPARG
ncbi:class I adenylate-forming enzyme family protein [Streptomyces hydrogenans]|uniref:class I adenylate-forming enzyme family protein n=1 Tax=Streptomyces hydrogenans TaxID=1873719 RepID=UPI00380B809E